ncbi:hypothetical protein [Nostoc sp. FACHB-190]|uniref:hypothetical protein n=1 Tax=Nostoc sp. FACHB-190 TaxID=2692838 RepID=UPI001682BC36|nr:hypothetical protein [Nostoc sp. FACHB-190]MBD2303771.1 hypothetical protein [Nostoc sp. FACHB-190]
MVRQQRQPRQRRPPDNDGWEPPQQAESPLPGLEPVGGGFYATPDQPVSPFDCSRWPDSPYCGGNPFTRDFVDFGLSKIQDECNIGVQFAPSLGFIKLPIYQFVYRFPGDCRLPPPPRKPERNEVVPTIPPKNICEGDDFLGLLLMKESISRELYWVPNTQKNEFSGERTTIYQTVLIKASRGQGETFFDPLLRREVSVRAKITLGISFSYYDDFEDIDYENSWEEDFIITSQGVGSGNYAGNYLRFQVSSELGRVYYSYGDFVEGCNRWGSRNIYENRQSEEIEIVEFRVPYIFCENTPNPPPPKDCECMCRCNNDSNNDQLLRLILKRIGPLPASVPNSLVKKNSGTRQIESLAQYIAYSVIQTNAQFGQFPQEIKIQDADLTQEGDQQQTVTMPNLAESIAEIVGLLLVLRSESAANLVATVNAMIEAGSAKQSAILASDYGAANAEFLGYKGKQIERQVPFTFIPGETQLDKMLKPGEQKVKGWENDDKNDLNDLIAPILEMAAMYRAANFRNIGTSSPLEKIKDVLKGAVKLSDAVDTFVKTPPPPDPNNPDAPPPPPKKSDWDEFVESAETGFISKPGITDNLHPYDRPLEQRPKIREFGTDTSEST